MIANSESVLISVNKNLINQIHNFASKLNVSQDIIVSLAIKEFMDRYEINQDLLHRINKANQNFPDEDEKKVLKYMRNLHYDILHEEQW
ncbi:putative Ribbon-helix-helix protein CopG domain-containing protein [Candidatus Magnetomoraceae bacterium gMMP-15]